MATADTLRTSPCNLCPRACGALRDQGQRGICGADGRLMAARAALHFWEEPPISGEAGSGTVFLSHCPLHCAYCQNGELASGEAGWEVSEERLARVFCDLQAQGALNINLVTPTQYAPALISAVALARRQGLDLPVAWNTSGYETVAAVRALQGTADIFLTDFKYADATLAQRYSQAPDYPQVALAALAEMVRVAGPCRFDRAGGRDRMTGGVIVRHLLLPGALEASKRALAAAFDAVGNQARFSIMNQYTPVAPAAVLERFPELGERVPDEEYEELLDFADDLGIRDYYWQQGGACEESFIPTWDGQGIL